MAKLNLHSTVNTAVVKGGDLYAPEASIKAEERPDWMKRWEKTGLLKFTDKNGDGRIQYYNDATKNEAAKAKAAAAGWKGNELTVNADIIVLANPEIALLPNWVIGLVAAGGSGCCAVHCCRFADGHLCGGVARPGQKHLHAQHL
jgi:cation/acetate symporter